MNPDTMCLAEYERLFPEHAKTKKVYEKSQIIANFTDFLRSNGIEACQKHVHVDACYGPWKPTLEPIGAFLREVDGIKHRSLLCALPPRGVSPGVYAQVPAEVMTELTARYFGINLAAYDQEEVELRKLRADDYSMPSMPSFELSPEGHIECPCWATGKYIWVAGCAGHPRESIT
jgi:hypothetical protein